MSAGTNKNGRITLVLGGTRSGKSSFAQRLVEESGTRPIYIATAEAFDEEMKDRIERHQQDRGSDWQTVEESRDIAAAITNFSSPQSTILIDCLTIWLSNLMLADANIEAALENLVNALQMAQGPVILVSNEIGSGIVPESPLGRKFRDEAGRLNQQIATIAKDVALITAGLPIWLKGAQTEQSTYTNRPIK